MKKRIILTALILVFCLIACSYAVGSLLSQPSPRSVGSPPEILDAETVQFTGPLGNRLSGWLVQETAAEGVILLLHGVHSNRLEMVDRALFLNAKGYSVLLIDFQGHGESEGEKITFGYQESYDVEAAVDFLKERFPDQLIGIIGVSLGGAAVLLSSVAEKVQALVIESVYPTITEAVSNRLAIWLGEWGRFLTPLLTWQSSWQLGVDAEWLQPIKRMAALKTPVLVIAGSEDRHTLLNESKRMYVAAAGQKELWIVDDAGHENYHRLAPEAYENRVLTFFSETLR